MVTTHEPADMKLLAGICEKVKTATGNDKLTMLKKYESTYGFKDLMRFIYNPYCKTGLSKAKATRLLDPRIDANGMTMHDAIDYFSTHTTGSDQDVHVGAGFVSTCVIQYGVDAADLAIAMLTQSLKLGVSVTSLNKVYGSTFIPKTGCMLGTLFSDVPPSRVAWPCIVTEKLDGIRRVLIKENGTIRMFSRSGHEDTGLVDIISEAKYLPDNFVYDGELLAIGSFKDSIAQRQATNSIAAGKGRKTGLTFNVFDMVPVDEFYAGKSSATALGRKIRLGATLRDSSISLIDENWFNRIQAFGAHDMPCKFIKPVSILAKISNMSEAEPILAEIWGRGGEGIMLNTVNGLYETKRSKALLKVKHTEERVLKIVDIIEGTGKYEDSMGSLICEYISSMGTICYVGVGSGFTDDMRLQIWRNAPDYIDRPVEVECFGESTNAQGYASLNCPIFLRFADEVHE